MPPRANARRKDAQSENYREFGVVGRKTGIGLPNTGARDEHGLAPLDGLFSSPEKESPNPNALDDRTQGAMDMDLESDAPPGPLSVMKRAHNRLLPRATSPRKTNMQSPAIRNPHIGRSSSPVRGTVVSSDSPPQRSPTSVVRKLDYGSSKTNGTRAKGSKASRLGRAAASPDHDEEEETILRGRDNSPIVNGGDDSMHMVDDPEPVVESDSDKSIVERTARSPKKQPAKRKAGRPKKNKAPEPEPQPGPESEPEPEMASESQPESEPQSVIYDEAAIEGGTDESDNSVPAARRRGRPTIISQAKESDAAAKKSGKRRRPGRNSTGEAEGEGAEDQPEEGEEEDRSSKRQRTAPASKATKSPSRGKPKATPALAEPTITAAKEASKSKSKAKESKEPKAAKAKAPTGKRERPRQSDVGNDSNVGKVQKGPPLPKSRGLYSLKQQGDNTITTTRSGRHSYRPLDYWKNERVVLEDEDVWEDGVSQHQKQDRFVLPTIKEVLRVEDQEPAPTNSRDHRRPKGKGGKTKRGVVDDDQEPPEPWEMDDGRIEGETIVWDPDYEVDPPAPDEPVEFEHTEIAVASGAIQTREIRDATFRFAKLLSLPFFGAGVVDLPPGTEKKPKNSRKNHMTFFVHYGKVLVTVNESQFRISAGGLWIVPRANYYAIQNDYDQPARLFFSQGSEVLVEPPQGRAQAA